MHPITKAKIQRPFVTLFKANAHALLKNAIVRMRVRSLSKRQTRRETGTQSHRSDAQEGNDSGAARAGNPVCAMRLFEWNLTGWSARDQHTGFAKTRAAGAWDKRSKQTGDKMDFRHNDIRRFGLISALAILLSGCGGSGGATPEEAAAAPADPVADDAGTGNDSGTDAGPAVGEKVTIRGLVTDAPIVNAHVSVTVGDEVFDAPLLTDGSGAYEVEIESTDADQLVYCQAVDQTGTVRFAAVPSTFGELTAAAQSGAVSDMNITNVTTAHQVLVRQFLEDGQIQSVTQLRDMAQFVDTRALLELSAAIKLVVEQREGIALPAGIADSLALAEAIASGESTFVADVQVSNPGAFELALSDVVSDGHTVLAFSAAGATGVYADAQTGDVLMLLEQGGYLIGADQAVSEISSWVGAGRRPAGAYAGRWRGRVNGSTCAVRGVAECSRRVRGRGRRAVSPVQLPSVRGRFY